MLRFWVLAVFCVISAAVFAEDTNQIKNELLQEKKSDKIIIPDVNLKIKDESSVPLQNDIESDTNDKTQSYNKINMEELTRTKESEKFKSDLGEERKKDNFSLSSFKFYYGRYENLLAEVNIGKKSGDLNYLLTYLRNKRASVGIDTNTYFNTELEVDDLNGDFIYTLSSNIELNANAGYYVRNIGLYTNATNLSENKLNIPFKLGMVNHPDIKSTLRADVDFDHLQMTHKTMNGYDSRNLWETGGSLDFESNWSRDNFLKLGGKYSYSAYSNDNLHYGRVSAVDRFPLLSNLFLEMGADVNLYNYKGYFWIPRVLAIYKYSPILSLKMGMTGEQNNITIERYMNENQMDYRLAYPDEKWAYVAGANYSPWSFLSLRGNVSYQTYYNMANYAYNPATDLYNYTTRTNIGVLELEGIAEVVAFENLVVNASYKYRLPDVQDLLFFYNNQAALSIDYKYPEWGVEAGSRLTYKGPCNYRDNAQFDQRFIWDLNLAKSITKDIFAELKLLNLLNQPNFEKPCVPSGGFGFNAGIRILL